MPLSIIQEKKLITLVNEAGGIHNLDIQSVGDLNPGIFGEKNTPERKCLYNKFNYWRRLPAKKLSSKLNPSPNFFQKQQEPSPNMSMQPVEDDLFGNSESPSLASSSLSSHASQGTPYWDVINVDTNRPFHNGPLAIFLVSKLVYDDTQRSEYCKGFYDISRDLEMIPGGVDMPTPPESFPMVSTIQKQL